MVTAAVKRDGEVGLAYMKSFERKSGFGNRAKQKEKQRKSYVLVADLKNPKDEIVELLKEELGVKRRENALEIFRNV